MSYVRCIATVHVYSIPMNNTVFYYCTSICSTVLLYNTKHSNTCSCSQLHVCKRWFMIRKRSILVRKRRLTANHCNEYCSSRELLNNDSCNQFNDSFLCQKFSPLCLSLHQVSRNNKLGKRCWNLKANWFVTPYCHIDDSWTCTVHCTVMSKSASVQGLTKEPMNDEILYVLITESCHLPVFNTDYWTK